MNTLGPDVTAEHVIDETDSWALGCIFMELCGTVGFNT